MRTQFEKIIRRACGRTCVRLVRQSFASNTRFTLSASGLRNSERIAAKHYLQVRDEDFDKATKTEIVMPQMVPHQARMASQAKMATSRK